MAAVLLLSLVAFARLFPMPLEPPTFWATFADCPLLGPECRVHCIHCLFNRHISPGMKLSEVGRILNHPTWLDEREIYGYNNVAFCGYIPVAITADSTTFNFRVFPELGNGMGAVYFRISGTVDRADIARLLRGEKAAGGEEPVILEISP